MYHNDERNGIPYANNFFQKGHDNVYFSSGGIQEFAKNYPDYLGGPEKEKYINIKKERELQAKQLKKKRALKNPNIILVHKLKKIIKIFAHLKKILKKKNKIM